MSAGAEREDSGRIAIALLAASLMACDSPQARINHHRKLYETYPPQVQQRIRAGQVDVGFTKEMVLMALGHPTLTYDRETEGSRQEVWVYRERGNGTGLGISIGGGFGSSVGGGGGIGVGGSGETLRDRARVIFERGQVVEAELPS